MPTNLAWICEAPSFGNLSAAKPSAPGTSTPMIAAAAIAPLFIRLPPVFFANVPKASYSRIPRDFREKPIRIAPTNRAHESIDVARRLGAKVDVIGMLVHIERKNGNATSQRMAVVRRPLIDELSIARRPRQQYPAGAAAECFAHGHEFGTPPLIRAKISSNLVFEKRPRLAFVP